MDRMRPFLRILSLLQMGQGSRTIEEMKAGHQQSGFRTLLGGGSLVVGALAAAWIGAFAVAQIQGPAAKPAPAAESPAAAASTAAVEGVDFIAVAEDEPWMAAVAAPLAARLGAAGRIPPVIALSSPPTPEAANVIRLAAPKRLLLLTVAERPKLGPLLSDFSPEVMAHRRGSGSGQLCGGEAILGSAEAGGGCGRRRRGSDRVGGRLGRAAVDSAAASPAVGRPDVAGQGAGGTWRGGGVGGGFRRPSRRRGRVREANIASSLCRPGWPRIK